MVDKNFARREMDYPGVPGPKKISGQLVEASNGHVAADLRTEDQNLTKNSKDFRISRHKKTTKKIIHDSTRIDNAQNDAEILINRDPPTNLTRIDQHSEPHFAEINTLPQFPRNQKQVSLVGVNLARQHFPKGPAPAHRTRYYKRSQQRPQLTGEPIKPPANQQTQQQQQHQHQHQHTIKPSKPPLHQHSPQYPLLFEKLSEPPANQQTQQWRQLARKPSKRPSSAPSQLPGPSAHQQPQPQLQLTEPPATVKNQLQMDVQKPGNGPFRSVAGGVNNPKVTKMSSDVVQAQTRRTKTNKRIGKGIGESVQKVEVAESLNNLNELGDNSAAPFVSVELSSDDGNMMLNRMPSPLDQNQPFQLLPGNRMIYQQPCLPHTQAASLQSYPPHLQNQQVAWISPHQFGSCTYYTGNELLNATAVNASPQCSGSSESYCRLCADYSITAPNQTPSPLIQCQPSQTSLGYRFADQNQNSPHRYNDPQHPPHLQTNECPQSQQTDLPFHSQMLRFPPQIYRFPHQTLLLPQRIPYSPLWTTLQPLYYQMPTHDIASRNDSDSQWLSQAFAESQPRFEQQQQQHGTVVINTASQSLYQADSQLPIVPPSSNADQPWQQEQNVVQSVTRPTEQTQQSRANYNLTSIYQDITTDDDDHDHDHDDDQQAKSTNFYSTVPH